MTYNPNSHQTVEQVSIDSTIAQNTAPKSTLSNLQNKFKSSDATTVAAWQFPEVAPLIFPALDDLPSEGDDGAKKKNAIAKKHAFVADYMDRRATSKYVSVANTH